MKQVLKHTPNGLTLLNLLLGCIAIVFVLTSKQAWVPYLMMGSLLADLLDGAVARALGVSSPIGKELDSLADVVSFGVLPGMIMYNAYETFADTPVPWLNYFSLLIPVCAALRLARFNVLQSSNADFTGLPSPAAAMFVLGVSFYLGEVEAISKQAYWVLPLCILLVSALMVSTLPMPGFKIKSFAWKGNEIKYIFAVFFLVAVMWFQWFALAPLILLYILASIILIILKK